MRKTRTGEVAKALSALRDARQTQIERDEAKKERDAAFEGIVDTQDENDKQLLTLSVGFLAVILAFIKDVVPLREAVLLWLLYTSCIVLMVCIAVVLVSFRLSIAAHSRAMKYYEKQMCGEEIKFPECLAKAVRWLNEAATGLFLIGVVCCLTFVILNVRQEAKNGKQSTTTCVQSFGERTPR